MRIRIVTNYQTSENCYIVYDEDSNKAVVIDPGSKADRIIAAAAEEGVSIEYIMLTHCHYDHIEGLEPLREKTGAPLITGKQCAVNVADPDINITFYGLGHEISAKRPEIIFDNGETIDIAGMKVKCITTPGHTNCSVCWLFGEDVLFSGDTLFLRNVGRWDLPTGNGDMLRRSIRDKLYTLSDEVKVYPGHGADTSIGYEKKYNFYCSL